MKRNLQFLLSVIFFLSALNTGTSQTFTSSNLPIVVINTNSQNINTAWQYIIVNMGVIDNGAGNRNYLTDPFNHWSGPIEIKLHGSSSVNYPKKTYKIHTLNAQFQKAEIALLGMPPEEDWILKGVYIDKSLIRDDFTYALSRQMGNYSSRTQFFELVVDGDYRGVYILTEKVKRDPYRINIAKLKEDEVTGNELTGGYIIKLDGTEPTDEGWYSAYPSNATQDSSNFFIYEYPNPDSMPFQQKQYIKNYFDKLEYTFTTSWWNHPDTGYGKYIHIPSFVDNFIMNELSRNVDGYRKSTFFYKDRDDNGDGRLHSGPLWDYELGWGNCSYNGGNNAAGWQYQWYAYNNYVPFWWWQFMADPAFKSQLKCRYTYLRSTVLSQANMFAYIDSMAARLGESQQRNFTKWPIMGTYIAPNPMPVPPDYDAEVARVKNWITNRLNWMDANMPGNCTDISVPEIDLGESSVMVFPNPFSSQFNIAYKLNSAARVKTELQNLLGETVLLIAEGEKSGGTWQQEVSAALPAGVYLLKMTVNEKVLFKKIITPGTE
jgi:hypothetical protein